MALISNGFLDLYNWAYISLSFQAGVSSTNFMQDKT